MAFSLGLHLGGLMETKHRSLICPFPLAPLAASLALALSLPASMAMADDRSAPFGVQPVLTEAGSARSLERGLPKTPSTPRYVLPGSLPKTNHPPNRPAMTLLVTNCNSTGAGSLREAIAASVSGDTISFAGLMCSTITLTTGITIEAVSTNLTLAGPGASQLTIEGGVRTGNYNRVFTHLGTGTLTVQGLTIANAKYEGATNVSGGCIYSEGNVTLSSSTISGCQIVSNATAAGGAIFALGNVTLISSTVSGNQARSVTSGDAAGGGVSCNGFLNVNYSTIDSNQAISTAGFAARGGGLFAAGLQNVTISNSTISRNQSKTGAGLYIGNNILGTTTTSIDNSTISGNVATEAGGGGIVSNATFTTILNSTIAFNTGLGAGAGLFSSVGSVQMQSSIVAGNRTSEWVPSDVAATSSVTGANNLITSSTTGVPIGTLGSCPKLGPLADNGGPTQTHQLLHNVGAISPAIDAGNNMIPSTYDQRSTGFSRTFGATTDIGAYEWQGETGDRMFVNGFEDVCN